MAGDRNIKIGKLELISGLAGGLCPVPVVGEILFAVPLYKSRATELAGKSRLVNGVMALCTSALARYSFYEPFYFPMLNKIAGVFS